MNDRLGLKKFAEGELPPLASVAGHFVSTERRFGVLTGAVDIDHAGLEPGGDLSGAFVAG